MQACTHACTHMQTLFPLYLLPPEPLSPPPPHLSLSSCLSLMQSTHKLPQKHLCIVRSGPTLLSAWPYSTVFVVSPRREMLHKSIPYVTDKHMRNTTSHSLPSEEERLILLPGFSDLRLQQDTKPCCHHASRKKPQHS